MDLGGEGGQAFIKAGPKFEIKHNERCFQKSKYVDWRGQARQLWGLGPPCSPLAPALAKSIANIHIQKAQSSNAPHNWLSRCCEEFRWLFDLVMDRGIRKSSDLYGAREPSFRFHDQNYECVWFLLIFLLSYCAVVIKFIAAPGSVMTSH